MMKKDEKNLLFECRDFLFELMISQDILKTVF